MLADWFSSHPDSPFLRPTGVLATGVHPDELSHCFGAVGTNEAEIGTAADLELLKSTLQRLPTGPSRVDTVMIQNADHMYRGEEAQVAQAIARWASGPVPEPAPKVAAQRREPIK